MECYAIAIHLTGTLYVLAPEFASWIVNPLAVTFVAVMDMAA